MPHRARRPDNRLTNTAANTHTNTHAYGYADTNTDTNTDTRGAKMSDTTAVEAAQTDAGTEAVTTEEGFAGAAAFADAEAREILNLLADDSAGGSCCGGSCCSA